VVYGITTKSGENGVFKLVLQQVSDAAKVLIKISIKVEINNTNVRPIFKVVPFNR
jgi:hypothetical protein